MSYRFRISFFLGFLLIGLLSGVAIAEGINFPIFGPIFGPIDATFSVFTQPQAYQLKATSLLNPNQTIIAFPEWKNRVSAISVSRIHLQKIGLLYSQVRWILDTDKAQTTGVTIVDDCFFEMPIQDAFLFFGKKNIREGVGFGFNPTDFFGEKKTVDRSRREEDRRVEREGDYVVGMDAFFDKFSVSAGVCPRIDVGQSDTRVFAKATVLLDEINTDLSLHYLGSSLSGVGYNLSSTFGDSLVVYSETAYRYGISSKKVVALIQDGTPRQYKIREEGHTQFVDTVLGGQFTCSDRSNVILEYHYHGGGYDDAQWRSLTDYSQYSHDLYLKNTAPELMKSYLQQANGLMNVGKMRQHMVFLRYSCPELFDRTLASVAILYGLADGSCVSMPYIEYRYSDTVIAYLSLYLFSGSTTSEFGLLNWDSQVTCSMRWFF